MQKQYAKALKNAENYGDKKAESSGIVGSNFISKIVSSYKEEK